MPPPNTSITEKTRVPNRPTASGLTVFITLAIMTSGGVQAAETGKVVFQSVRGGNSEILVMDPDGTNVQQLTDNDADDFNPRWSPDARRITFTSTRDGNAEIYIMDADGSNQIRLTDHPSQNYGSTWSPDGSMIAYNTDRSKTVGPKSFARTWRAPGAGI